MNLSRILLASTLFLFSSISLASSESITDDEMAKTLRMQEENQMIYIPHPNLYRPVERERWPGQWVVKSQGRFYVRHADNRYFAFVTREAISSLLREFPRKCSTRHQQILSYWNDFRYPESVKVVTRIAEGLVVLFNNSAFLVAPRGLENDCAASNKIPACALAWQRLDNYPDPFDCK